MPDTNYDFPIPTISGQSITVQWLVNDPRRIYRLMNTLVQRYLIGHKVLAGRVDLTGTGSAIYEISEAIVADLSSGTVSPLGQYPMTTTTPGVLAAIKPLKDGLDSLIADEDIAHNRIDKVMRDLIKIANTLVLKADGIVMAIIASQVTNSQAVQSGAWNTANGNPFLDAMLTKAGIIGQNKGYDPNTVVCSFVQFAWVVSRAVVLQGMPRETADNLIASGNMARIAGMTYLATNNGPANPLVLDNNMLGSLAFEELGGNYQGSARPPAASDDNPASSGVETKRWRDENVDGVQFRGRLVRAPMIQEPAAAAFITGAGV
jgi:hypothetical protein